MNQYLKVLLIAGLTACTLYRSNGQPEKQGASWSQFRGPNGSGIASPNDRPPVEFGENTNLLWKISLPVGASSPVLWENKIYLTAFVADKKELQTLCIDRETGKILWSNSIFPEKFEKNSAISNPAQSTIAVDETGVYVYFASHGIRSLSHTGVLRWDFPMPVYEWVSWGHATSPVVMDDKVLLSIDFGNEKIRCLMALNKFSGEVAWKTPIQNLSGYNGHSTPVRYQDKVIVHRCGAVCSYSLTDGSPVWWLPLMTLGESTPVIHNQVVYVGAWTNFTEAERRGNFFKYDSFEKALNDFDKDGNKLISEAEIPEDLLLFVRPELLDSTVTSDYSTREKSFQVRWVFSQSIDTDKSGFIDNSEWSGFYNYWKNLTQDLGILALPLGLTGELSMHNVLWMQLKKNPEIPSPLVYNENVYMVADGGWVTCMDAKTGEVTFQEKIGVPGPYLASPVAANGHIYAASHNGNVMVITAQKKPEVVFRTQLKGKILATPAIEGNYLYIRTSEYLYAFMNAKLP
jgi:outer membrane protein assembly factor BamB